MKNRLKHSGASLAEVLHESKDNEVIGKMKVLDLLQSMPGLGKVDSQYLGSLRTLRDIVASMAGPPTSGSPPPQAVMEEAVVAMGTASPIARSVLAAVPAEEGPQRPFDFGPGREIVIARDAAGLAEALAERFTAAGLTAKVIDPVRAEKNSD